MRLRHYVLTMLFGLLALGGWLWLTMLSPYTYDRPAHLPEIEAGEHSWQYDLAGSGAAPVDYTMDTPLRNLAQDLEVWRAVTEAFGKHFPGIPLDASAPEAATISLNIVLEHIPGASRELENDLMAAVGQEGNR